MVKDKERKVKLLVIKIMDNYSKLMAVIFKIKSEMRLLIRIRLGMDSLILIKLGIHSLIRIKLDRRKVMAIL